MPVPRLPALLLLPTVALFAAEPAPPVANNEQGIRVERVEIDGCRMVHPDRVEFLLAIRAGRRIGQRELLESIADDVKAIERLGPFSDIKAAQFPGSAPDSVVVRYSFRELPYVQDVKLAGVSFFQRDGVMKLLEIKKGGHLNSYQMEGDRRAIQRKLEDDGRRHAQVDAKVVELPPGSGFVTVTYAVDAGASIKVGGIEFIGLPDDLPRVLLREERTLLNRISEPYQPELLPLDGSALIRRIQDLGWLDARLVESHVEVTDLVLPLDDRRRHGPNLAPDGERDDRVVIIYKLDCGARYSLGDVAFVGDTAGAATEAELLAAFNGLTEERGWPVLWRVLFATFVGAKLGDGHTMQTGDWFLAEEMYGSEDSEGTVGAVERARRVVSNRGYARAELIPSRRLDLDKHIVHLTLQIRPGQVYTIGRVDIRGNDTTRDRIARRALSLHPGQQWNDDDLDESKRQLRRLGLFKESPGRPMRIVRQYPNDRPNEVDLVVELTEKETAQLNLGGGYSSASGLFLQFGFEEANFDPFALGWPPRGAGQQVGANLYLSKDRNAVSSSWTNPHLFDGPWSWTLSGNLDNSKLQDWDERRISGGTSVGRNLFGNDVLLSGGYNFTSLDIRNIGDSAPDDAREDIYELHTVKGGITYDRLDNRLYPTRGMLASGSVSYTGLVGGDARYIDWRLRYDRFLPLHRRLEGGSTVLRFSGSWRQIDSTDGNGVPFYARFMGGGSSPNHRGYDQNGEGPFGFNKKGNRSRLGGTREILATGELIIPVQGTDDGIRLVLFSDTGWVWSTNEAVHFNDLRVATGIGIRFPQQLPVALDFAWLVNRRDEDQPTQVHFSLGQIQF